MFQHELKHNLINISQLMNDDDYHCYFIIVVIIIFGLF